MTAAQKHPFKVAAQSANRKLRQRMSSADPEQLLVRHEMWLQTAAVDESSQTSQILPTLVLVHYLGDDAFQMLTVPPRPIRVRPLAVRTLDSQTTSSADVTHDVTHQVPDVFAPPRSHRALESSDRVGPAARPGLVVSEMDN